MANNLPPKLKHFCEKNNLSVKNSTDRPKQCEIVRPFSAPFPFLAFRRQRMHNMKVLLKGMSWTTDMSRIYRKKRSRIEFPILWNSLVCLCETRRKHAQSTLTHTHTQHSHPHRRTAFGYNCRVWLRYIAIVSKMYNVFENLTDLRWKLSDVRRLSKYLCGRAAGACMCSSLESQAIFSRHHFSQP